MVSRKHRSVFDGANISPKRGCDVTEVTHQHLRGGGDSSKIFVEDINTPLVSDPKNGVVTVLIEAPEAMKLACPLCVI